MTKTPGIETTSGPVVGERIGRVDRFLGIPYAGSLFGAGRWLAPTEPEPWQEVRACTSFGATAPTASERNPRMLPFVDEHYVGGPGFLNLNVWTPCPRGSALLPVLVWIHGGGYFGGASSNPWYDGASFAGRGLVFVSFNYRLGAMGFASISGAPENRGVLDWLAALRWVRDNIVAFGGDPAAVTIAGQSAGGFSVANLLGSTDARGLFSRAIIASGVSDSSTVSRERMRSASEKLATILGVDASLSDFSRTSTADIVAAQIALEAERGDVAEIPRLEGLEDGLLTWAPVRDGSIIRGSAVDGDQLSLSHDIPVLVGTTLDEFGWSYTMSDPDDDRASEFADRFMRYPTQRFIDARTGPAPTFRYEFRWRSRAAIGIGAAHSLDLPFLFNNLAADDVVAFTGSNPPQSLADAMHDAFATFARVGSPGWPSYEATRHVTRIFDNTVFDESFVVGAHG